MPRHSAVDSENKEEPLLSNLSNVRTTRCSQKCCYLLWLLFGTSVPLVLGFYMGYKYEEDNCSCGSN
jgi:hypothetical protein